MFLVILTYTTGSDELDTLRDDHMAWLDAHYASGLLISSGRQVPRMGAVMLTRHARRSELEAVLDSEPFVGAGLARYDVIEFTPSRGVLADLPVVTGPAPQQWHTPFRSNLSAAKRATTVGGDACVLVRGGEARATKQGLPSFAGVSQESSGAQALCLHVVMIPPGGRAHAHLHADHESAVYIVSGEADLWHGAGLAEHVILRPGDFVYIPASVPHLPANRSATEPLVGVIARTDPNEQESVVLLPELDHAFSDHVQQPHRASAAGTAAAEPAMRGD